MQLARLPITYRDYKILFYYTIEIVFIQYNILKFKLSHLRHTYILTSIYCILYIYIKMRINIKI